MRRIRFVDILLRGSGPTLLQLGIYALGVLAISVLANGLYDLSSAPQPSAIVWWRPLALIGALCLGAYLLWRRDVRVRRNRLLVHMDDRGEARPHQGLIWLFGPGPFEHLVFALKHHAGPAAQHCWLILQDSEPVRHRLAELEPRLRQENLPALVHPVYIDRLDVQDVHDAVRRVFGEADTFGLQADDVIADITGGTKILTSGMMLAALAEGGALEYVEGKRDEQGQAMQPQRVVFVNLEFYIAQGG